LEKSSFVCWVSVNSTQNYDLCKATEQWGIGKNSAVANSHAQRVQKGDTLYIWVGGKGYVAVAEVTADNAIKVSEKTEIPWEGEYSYVIPWKLIKELNNPIFLEFPRENRQIQTITGIPQGVTISGFFQIDKNQSLALEKLFEIRNDEQLRIDEIYGSGREVSPAVSRTTLTETLVSDPRVVSWIKNIYKGKCQFCKIVITTPNGKYSEAAHIKAKRDNGDDHEQNVLSLCPNCHKQFDKGAIWLTDNLEIVHFKKGTIGEVFKDERHIINIENVKFHRNKFS
jgi:5-methylcytosine-specific restriction endonuclease McrA